MSRAEATLVLSGPPTGVLKRALFASCIREECGSEVRHALHGDRALQEPGRKRSIGGSARRADGPEGLTYVGSWIEVNFDRCFQLMECSDARLLQSWVSQCTT